MGYVVSCKFSYVKILTFSTSECAVFKDRVFKEVKMRSYD